MKGKVRILFAAIFWTHAVFAYIYKPNDPRQLAYYFDLTMNRCPEKIWDNYSWENFKVALVYSSLSKVYEWDGSSGRIHEYELDQYPRDAREDAYAFIERDGVKTLSLNIRGGFPHHNFMLGIHEGFHFIGQDNWVRPGNIRGTHYPLDYRPRYLRRMLFDKMLSAFESGKEENIAQAKYWYQKWSDEYPEEAKKTLDRIEGVAEYITLMAQALLDTKKGCRATDPEIKRQLLGHLPQYRKYVSELKLDHDAESYALGSLASLLLRFTQESSHWQKEIIRGKTPLEILFEDYSPLQNIDDDTLKMNFALVAQSRNKSIGQLVGSDLAAYFDQNYVRLNVPLQYFRSRLFLQLSSPKNTTVAILHDNHSYTHSSSSSIKLKGETVLFINRDKPASCGYGLTTLVHKNDIDQLAQGQFAIVAGNILALVEATEYTHADGMKFLCLDGNSQN